MLNKANAEAINLWFIIEFTFSIGSLLLDKLIGMVKFHVVDADIAFLLYFKDMDKLNVFFSNLKNVLITSTKLILVVCHFGHPFFLQDESLLSFLANFFHNNLSFITDIKLRQLHHCFVYLSAGKLYKVLKRASHKTIKKIIDNFTKYCTYCEKYEKSPSHFKFILKQDISFN